MDFKNKLWAKLHIDFNLSIALFCFTPGNPGVCQISEKLFYFLNVCGFFFLVLFVLWIFLFVSFLLFLLYKNSVYFVWYVWFWFPCTILYMGIKTRAINMSILKIKLNKTKTLFLTACLCARTTRCVWGSRLPRCDFLLVRSESVVILDWLLCGCARLIRPMWANLHWPVIIVEHHWSKMATFLNCDWRILLSSHKNAEVV